MIYQASLTIPKNTSKNEPVRHVMSIAKGLVYQLYVIIPHGVAGLAGIKINDGGYQVWPTTLDYWFSGDGVTMFFDETYVKESAPYEFLIYGYNLDDTYEHNLTVLIGMVSRDIFMARFLPNLAIDMQKHMWNELIKEQREAEIQQMQADEEAVLSNPFPWIED